MCTKLAIAKFRLEWSEFFLRSFALEDDFMRKVTSKPVSKVLYRIPRF